MVVNKMRKKSKLVFWGFLAPSLIGFFIIVVIPFFIGIYYSFTSWNGIAQSVKWIGIENYKYIFADLFSAKGEFRNALFNTVEYSILSVILLNILGFGLAIIVTRDLKTRNLQRTLIFMPNLIGGLILGFMWQFIFVEVLPFIGKNISILQFLNKVWLGDPHNAMWAMVIVKVWQMAGYIMIIYVAAIQNIPEELLEAAEIDGANVFQRLKNITFPLVAPAFTVSLFLTLANSFKIYDVNLSLTNGGPYRQTELLAKNIYDTAFLYNRFGLGQAKAVIFFILITIITLTQVYFTKKREVEM